ncbi:MAG: RNA 2'-phosphotransferase [Deltaproteobacteria bacterium]|nr:RNA 2'-phosphotransferase [Nannocystaceae bacterium]
MTDRGAIARSKRLSWLLRHGAGERGLAMDTAGWAAIDDVLVATGLSRDELDEAVRTNTKRRLQFDGERVRACQGHSQRNTAVTREGLERSWQRWDGEASLWHGTALAALDGIAAHGILPIARTHVHLADAPDATVGKRAHVDVLLEVDPRRLRARGLDVFVAPNAVVLVREVPPDCIVATRPTS